MKKRNMEVQLINVNLLVELHQKAQTADEL